MTTGTAHAPSGLILGASSGRAARESIRVTYTRKIEKSSPSQKNFPADRKSLSLPGNANVCLSATFTDFLKGMISGKKEGRYRTRQQKST